MAIDVDAPSALLAALAVVVAVALLWAASTSGAAFGAFNPSWDGGADLRDLAAETGAETTVVRDVTAYGRVPAEGSVAVVLSPASAYEPTEAERLRRFVEAGGTLVVAEDFGSNANPLLAAVGADARVDGRLLVDEAHHHRAPELPIAGDVAAPAHPYTADVAALTLNHGTAVVPGDATVLVNTSELAYLDSNRNGELDDSESVGPYPVATIEPVGGGAVVVVADPSALINVMLDRPGNRAFVAAVFAAHERVLLDYSHAGSLPPLSVAVLALRESALVQALVGLAAVSVVGLWAGRSAIARWYREGPRDRLPPWARLGSATVDVRPPAARTATLADELAERHPEWDPERVERVVSAVVAHEETEPTDDR